MANILLPQPEVVWGFRLHYVPPEIRRWFVGVAVIAFSFATIMGLIKGGTSALLAILVRYILLFIVTIVMIPAMNRFMRQIGTDSAGNLGISEYLFALVDVMTHVTLVAFSVGVLYLAYNI